MRTEPRPTRSPLSPAELRAERDRARDEYLAATRRIHSNIGERARLWRAFVEANATYVRARGGTR
jgi:hypothetical protein